MAEPSESHEEENEAEKEAQACERGMKGGREDLTKKFYKANLKVVKKLIQLR